MTSERPGNDVVLVAVAYVVLAAIGVKSVARGEWVYSLVFFLPLVTLAAGLIYVWRL